MDIVFLSKANKPVSIHLDFQSEEEVSFWRNDLIMRSDKLPGCSRSLACLLNTPKTRDTFESIFNKHKSKGKDAFLFTKILRDSSNIAEGDYFFIININLITDIEKFALLSTIVLHPIPKLWYEVFIDFKHKWERLSLYFEINLFGAFNERSEIGEKELKNKTCRFCGSSKNTFDKDAHAISEAIGNKLIFSLEECDVCNEKCNKIFEQDFIRLMDFRRGMFEVKTKRKLNEIKGANFTVKHEDKGGPTVYIKEGTPYLLLPNENKRFKFFHKEAVNDPNIYRSLVKSIVDVIPSHYLPQLKNTIKWMMKESDSPEILPLPPVRFAVLPKDICFSQPLLFLFIRKNEEIDVPFCTGVLFSTDVAYRFTVPLVDSDDDDFLYKEDFQELNLLLDSGFPYNWEFQSFTNWWDSYIWVYWVLNPDSDSFEVREKNDDIFAKDKIWSNEDVRRFEDNLFIPREFVSTGIPIVKDKRYIPKIKSKDFKGFLDYRNWDILIELDFRSNGLKFSISFPLLEKANSEKLTVSVYYKVKNLDRILKNGKYVTGDSFISLLLCIWDNSFNKIVNFVNNFNPFCTKLSLPPKDKIDTLINRAEFHFFMSAGIIKYNFFDLVGNDDLEFRFRQCAIDINNIKR